VRKANISSIKCKDIWNKRGLRRLYFVRRELIIKQCIPERKKEEPRMMNIIGRRLRDKLSVAVPTATRRMAKARIPSPEQMKHFRLPTFPPEEGRGQSASMEASGLRSPSK
jgi:hypothetical protein